MGAYINVDMFAMTKTRVLGNGRTRLHRARGAGLIEVLIAALVLAVGLLGMMTLQTTAKRYSYEAAQRSMASAVARDAIERMRSNPTVLPDYVATIGEGSISTAPTSCNTGTCTPAQLAARDLYEIELLLDGATERVTVDAVTSNAGGLVQPTACISHNAGNVQVAIAWRGVEEMTNPTESDCGEGTGLYGAGNVQRRLLVLSTFIVDV